MQIVVMKYIFSIFGGINCIAIGFTSVSGKYKFRIPTIVIESDMATNESIVRAKKRLEKEVGLIKFDFPIQESKPRTDERCCSLKD